MSKEEIKRDYHAAKDKNKQIGILADMNLCTKKEIKDIIEDKEKDPMMESIYKEIETVETRIKEIEDEMKNLKNWHSKLLNTMEVLDTLKDRQTAA